MSKIKWNTNLIITFVNSLQFNLRKKITFFRRASDVIFKKKIIFFLYTVDFSLQYGTLFLVTSTILYFLLVGNIIPFFFSFINLLFCVLKNNFLFLKEFMDTISNDEVIIQTHYKKDFPQVNFFIGRSFFICFVYYNAVRFNLIESFPDVTYFFIHLGLLATVMSLAFRLYITFYCNTKVVTVWVQVCFVGGFSASALHKYMTFPEFEPDIFSCFYNRTIGRSWSGTSALQIGNAQFLMDVQNVPKNELIDKIEW